MSEIDFRSAFSAGAMALVDSHPFFGFLSSEKMDAATTARFLQSFDHLVACFPPVVAAAAEAAQAPAIEAILRENLADELGHGDPTETHHAIYRRFLRTNDIPTLDGAPPLAAARWRQALIELMDNAESDAEVLGLLAAEEFLAIPCISRMYATCRHHYPGGDHGYFTTHLHLEEEHMAELVEAIEQLDDPALQAQILPSFEVAIGAWETYFTALLAELEAAPAPCGSQAKRAA